MLKNVLDKNICLKGDEFVKNGLPSIKVYYRILNPDTKGINGVLSKLGYLERKINYQNSHMHFNRLSYEDIKNFVEIESKSGCKLNETKESYFDKCKKEPKISLCKLDFICSCGNEFSLSFNTFKSSNQRKCKGCSAKINSLSKRYSYEEVKNYIEIESGSGCKLISSTYKNNHEKLKIQCSCGNIYERAMAEFKGQKLFKCKKCTGASIKPTYEDVKEDLNKNDIELFSLTYINQNSKLKIKYPCGFIAERDYANIKKSNYVCPHCIKVGYNRNTQRFKEEITEITDGEYVLLSEYKTMNDKVTIKHNKCGHIYEVTPHNFLDAGNRCPKCNVTKGEYEVESYLKAHNINYKFQYSFVDLFSDKGYELRFDFAVLNNLNEVMLLIEYDGIFHYKKVYEDQDFEGQITRDGKKDSYCKSHNIRLLRIPYWEFDNIKDILDKEIKCNYKGVDIYGKKNISEKNNI